MCHSSFWFVSQIHLFCALEHDAVVFCLFAEFIHHASLGYALLYTLVWNVWSCVVLYYVAVRQISAVGLRPLGKYSVSVQNAC